MMFFIELRVGLGIGVCCLVLENSSSGIYIYSFVFGLVVKMESNLRFVVNLIVWGLYVREYVNICI